MSRFETKYGYFDEQADEYIILRPDTPRPWVNVICPGDYGVVVSQTGSGYSWKSHASLNRITRWDQDLVRDEWGKYVYVRDDGAVQNGGFGPSEPAVWSLGWKPVCRGPEEYQVAHGIGYSRIRGKNDGIYSELTIFVPKDEPVELWLVTLTNQSGRPRNLSLFTYLEWALGAHDPHREFHKTFIETEFDHGLNAIWATKRLWELVNAKWQHWNRSWEYYAFHGVSEPVAGYEGDKENFLGMYGSLQRPKAVVAGRLTGSTGKWGDGIASLHNTVRLAPDESHTLVYILGAVETVKKADAAELIAKYRDVARAEEALREVKEFWQGLLGTVKVETPDAGFDLMTNTWLKYQAVSARLWGRTGYYQPGGAYGFRDQLQDSQIFLPIEPAKTKAQIKLHAAHQFREGRVNHWWHPLSEVGAENAISDNRLWLPFVTVNYLKETADFAFLDEKVPYRDGGEGTIYEHCVRAIEYNLARRSERGLPLIGDGDWNDGLNAVGTEGKGESVWLGHFFYGVLRDFAEVAERKGNADSASRYRAEADSVRESVNRYGWDDNAGWYIRATCDDGTILGGSNAKYGRIFLNAQTWAVISGTADEERAQKAMAAVKKYLSREYGPILLYPAFQEPDEKVGYLTRYAPGVREHGGLYTHAGTWAVMAAAKMNDAVEAWRMYRSMCPPYRGLNPDLYKVEPYVTPGNVDGPDSPNFGRGGWTWYTGSAAWMFRVGLEWLLGIRPEYEGLRVDPCIPEDWDGFSVRRRFRGATYEITVRNPRHVSSGVAKVVVDRAEQRSNLLPVFGDGAAHKIEVTMG